MRRVTTCVIWTGRHLFLVDKIVLPVVLVRLNSCSAADSFVLMIPSSWSVLCLFHSSEDPSS
jgi:hypothetical protein